MATVGITTVVMVLIYSPFQISIEEHSTSAAVCAQEAATKIGEKLKVTVWDNMGGSNPLPKVVAAFCAPGAAPNDH